MQFIDQALQATGGKTDGQALADAIKGAKVESPFTETGEITMRESDHTIIGYPVAWGQSRPDPKGFQNWERGDWDEILSMEAEWKKRQGYA